MRTVSLVDYLGYITTRLTSFLFRLVPVSLGLWLARRLGSLIYYLNRKRVIVAYQNLKAAMGPEMPPVAIKRMVKRVYQNLAQTLVEVLTFPRIREKYVKKYVTFEGRENLEEARNRKKGIIFLTGHFGDWELSGIIGGIIGYPLLVLAREQKHSHLNDLLNRYRELTGSKVIKKGFAIKDMLLALHKNEIIAMLVDQDAGKNGMFVDFFGRKTSFAPGSMSFALRTDATILPTFIIRQRGPYHKIVIEKPLKIDKTEDKEAALRKGLQAFAKILESYIRQYPEQWLWVHKRWKSTPTKKILILNDGKAGHLNQSIAVAEMVQRCRKDAGCSILDTRYSIVDVQFKNKTLRNIFNFGSTFACRQCQGCMWCLKFCLTNSSYRHLMREYADIIISCGASLEAVNLVISKELGAKNIVIMKPSTVSINRFNLVIAPKHDRLKQTANVIITEGAPTRITEEKLRKDSLLLAEKINLDKPIRIGVLIGGDNPEFALTPRIIHELIDALIEIACEIDAEILVTTSRRTSKEVEQILRMRLGKHLRCRLLVIANEKNIPEAVGGILGLSQIVIVSCESISMISEALSACNYTFIFELEKRKRKTSKHEAFLNNLATDGYARFVKTTDLFSKIKEVWESKPPMKKLDDSLRIYEAVKRIL